VAAIDLEDDLTIEESRWRGRLITIGVLLVVAVGAAVGFYVYRSGGGSTATRGTEDVTVVRKTINQTLIISGTADAQLNSNLIFQSSGKIASIDVKVGDVVKQGDVLASLQSDSLNNALQTAQANARAAQLKLEDLLAGSTEAQLAAADQAVASAQAGVTKAKDAQKTLLDGATAAELAGAEQAVSAAEAQLATSQSNRDKLNDAPTAADLAAAEAAVAQAQSALTAAQNAESSAEAAVLSAEAALKSAETSYCDMSSDPDFVAAEFCAARAAPISSADATAMNDALTFATLAKLASGVIATDASYRGAANSAASASASVTSAQSALTSAQKKLSALQDGPSSADIDAADAAVASAQASVDAANKKLQVLRDGATDEQKADAQSAVDSAEAALQSALAQRAEAVRGPDANTIEQARQAIVTAQLTVDAARIRLQDAQIIAPFDGTVGAINAKVGEFFGAGSQTPPIVLLTPDRLVMKMDVGETDYANVKVGQVGGVAFDSIPGKQYPFVISEIGLSPSLTQGVVTYPVKASLILPQDAPRPAPGMNARGIIITESKKDVLVVPPRALRRSGNDQVVDVRRNGKVEEQIVTTGASDTDNVEIVSGLNEGDIVVMAALAGTNGNATPQAQPTLPGGVR
jgi:RND family efflux transporter MFP subunit